MAFVTSRPNFSHTMPDVSSSGIALLKSITAGKIWKDDALQYGFGTSKVLNLDKEFAADFRSMFGNAQPDAQFAFAAQTVRAFKMIDAVSGLDFTQTTNVKKVDLVLTSTNDRPNSSLEGFNQFPGMSHKDGTNESWSFGAFNSGLKAMLAKPEAGGGQYGNWTVLHEIGHSLGLKHTHNDWTGNALPTVGAAMDNERYSVMSYKGASDGLAYGHAVSMMALDVAALQALYGVEKHAAGGSTYTLMNARGGQLSLAEGDVSIGRAYYCIWDSGGVDTINYKGSGNAVMINLNDATLNTGGVSADLKALFAQLKSALEYSELWTFNLSKALRDDIFDEWHHAGGFFSQVIDQKNGSYHGTDGGFSIAHGAKIENAVGGNKSDYMIGNEQNNLLKGVAGNDTMLGSRGGDTLNGGDGTDWLDGGIGNDKLMGGSGADWFVFSGGYGTDQIIDFANGDLIYLRNLGIETYTDITSKMTEVGNDVVIAFGSHELVILDQKIADFSVNDFRI